MMDLLQTCFLFHKTIIFGLESCRLLADYCDVFYLMFELILTLPMHCLSIDEQVMHCYISPIMFVSYYSFILAMWDQHCAHLFKIF